MIIRPTRIAGLIVLLSLAMPWLSVHGMQSLPRISHLFTVEDFDREGDGFSLTISNQSKRGFGDFRIVVLGLDMDYTTIYRREIEVEDFMEGQSERTFFLPGYDDRVFRVNIEVYNNIDPSNDSDE